jgi:hypothetical protein
MNAQSRFFGVFRREKRENSAAYAAGHMCIGVLEAGVCIRGCPWACSTAKTTIVQSSR